MAKQDDFKKELEKRRSQLLKFSKEAVELAKKGEKELVKFSRQSKLHIDSTAVSLKLEHLYYQIGKEYVRAKSPSVPNAKLKQLLEEFKKVERQRKLLKSKLTRQKKKTTSAASQN